MRKYIVLLITVFIIPLILSAASNEVYVDGKKLNPDVVIKNDRNPVITWTYEDPKYTKASIIKVTVNVSTDSDFTPLFSSFTGPAAKNNYRLLYSSIAAPLKE
ncbi:MAG: hypothetical protein PF545_04000 [Elusimicrobia bacterium]|nr:hypothetical protein [Elusimicrobiota bacterium]